IAAHPRSDPGVQQLARQEDRAFSRDLLSGGLPQKARLKLVLGVPFLRCESRSLCIEHSRLNGGSFAVSTVRQMAIPFVSILSKGTAAQIGLDRGPGPSDKGPNKNCIKIFWKAGSDCKQGGTVTARSTQVPKGPIPRCHPPRFRPSSRVVAYPFDFTLFSQTA